ncbi:hypothetical protein DQ237_15615 [Blastococcus sp. TF02-8]|uniref:YveK family protein n=1 Tax=Blastococcus sp. TF02-8 TaxID=2250574 RepID=UPI000DE82685|nr:Wzz/FepE/Etk N-terminal domain-containing protein [Blastococcus sp. TF02-8]RBY95124.1 hypothetical protein DQ237_15615 [Blastococcus sp. TF02-8]
MEFSEYLAAIRRYWTTVVGVLALCVALAALALPLTPRTYEATAQVFVSASPSIPNSAQYVNQRVKSYPDVVLSAPVLRPVIEDLDLTESFTSLRARVRAEVPADTSQLRITVSGRDAEAATEIANAVAEQVTVVIPELEESRSGDRPVKLTLSDPATPPTSPVSPVPLFVLGLGVLVGLFLGLAAAVLRSRLDTTLYEEAGVRAAWGAGVVPDLLVADRRGSRAGASSSVVRALARRIELLDRHRPVCVVLVTPAPDRSSFVTRAADQVVAALRGHGVRAVVERPDSVPGEAPEGITLLCVEPTAPAAFWRRIAERCDGVVVVVPEGATDRSDLRELRVLLEATGATPLAVALLPHDRRPSRADATSPADSGPAAPGTGADASSGDDARRITGPDRPLPPTAKRKGAGRQ